MHSRHFIHQLSRITPYLVFFFNDTATTEIYTLSLHDALPISRVCSSSRPHKDQRAQGMPDASCTRSLVRKDKSKSVQASVDRKSTRLNSSHPSISYAVFCLKKKKNKKVSTSLPFHCSLTVYTD